MIEILPKNVKVTEAKMKKIMGGFNYPKLPCLPPEDKKISVSIASSSEPKSITLGSVVGKGPLLYPDFPILGSEFVSLFSKQFNISTRTFTLLL